MYLLFIKKLMLNSHDNLIILVSFQFFTGKAIGYIWTLTYKSILHLQKKLSQKKNKYWRELNHRLHISPVRIPLKY